MAKIQHGVHLSEGGPEKAQNSIWVETGHLSNYRALFFLLPLEISLFLLSLELFWLKPFLSNNTSFSRLLRVLLAVCVWTTAHSDGRQECDYTLASVRITHSGAPTPGDSETNTSSATVDDVPESWGVCPPNLTKMLWSVMSLGARLRRNSWERASGSCN